MINNSTRPGQPATGPESLRSVALTRRLNQFWPATPTASSHVVDVPSIDTDAVFSEIATKVGRGAVNTHLWHAVTFLTCQVYGQRIMHAAPFTLSPSSTASTTL